MLTSRRIISSARRRAHVAQLVAAGTLALLSVLTVGCESSDPTAPEGSTITVSANPQTVLPGIPTEITATVRSENGTRLPDQEVLFNTTTGTLAPPAQTQLITDDDGQVTSDLSTTQTATVTASSGSITANTTVNVINCALQAIQINADIQNIQDCVTGVKLTVKVIDTAGDGCVGVAVKIVRDTPSANANDLMGTISPLQGVTDSNGEFMATFDPSQNQCQTECSASANPPPPNGGVCEANFVGQDSGGSISSPKVTITDSVP